MLAKRSYHIIYIVADDTGQLSLQFPAFMTARAPSGGVDCNSGKDENAELPERLPSGERQSILRCVSLTKT